MKNKLLLILGAVVIVAVIVLAAIIISRNPELSEDDITSDQIKGVSTQTEAEENRAQETFKTMSIAESKELIAIEQGKDDFAILDIRTPNEYAEGHIDGAENIDFYEDFEKQISGLDKNKSYLIYCRSGNRSSQAMNMFKSQGFSKVYEIGGGYNTWIQ